MQIGILGTGKIAVDHVAAFQSLGHTVVAGCATSSDSPRWRAFQEVASEARFEPDGEALLGAPDVDVIVTCLPWDVTERWLPCLLATQKPVLIEKPMALSSSAARNAMARPQSNLDNKIIGYNRRFYAPVRKLSERLQQGGLKSAEITISEALTRLIKRHGRDVIDHVVVYSSSHTIDTAVYLLGALKPVHVYSYDEKRYPVPFAHGIT
jgi:predicted dehydrogenase